MSFSVIHNSPSGAAVYYSGAYAHATGATGSGGIYATAASAANWDSVSFKNAAHTAGYTLATGSSGTALNLVLFSPASVIGGGTPIGDVRGEQTGYSLVSSSTVVGLDTERQYTGALYAVYSADGVDKLTGKVGVGTTNFTGNGYYAGIFTTRDNHDFETDLTVDTGNLNLTGLGSGVYTIGETVTLQTSVIDRIGNSLNTVSSITEDSFVKSLKISILDEDRNIIYGDYKTDYKNPSFTFTKQENIDLFGSFTKNFGVRFTVENQDGGSHDTDFLLYGNRLSIDKIYVSASGGTYLDENPDNDYGPSTGTISNAADRIAALSGFSHRLINTSGTTGAINFNVTFDQTPNFTDYDNLLVFAHTGTSVFDTTTENLLGTFPLTQLENQNIRIFPDDGVEEGEPNFFKFVASSEIGFYNELFTVGPYTLEPVEVGTDPILYNVGEQEIVSGNLSILGDGAGGLYALGASGTGYGQRITGPGHLPYLLSGDPTAETQNLQQVTDIGNTTTNSIISSGPYVSGKSGLFNYLGIGTTIPFDPFGGIEVKRKNSPTTAPPFSVSTTYGNVAIGKAAGAPEAGDPYTFRIEATPIGVSTGASGTKFIVGSGADKGVGIGTSVVPTGNSLEVVGIGTTVPSFTVGSGSGTAGVGIGTTYAPADKTLEVVGLGTTSPSIVVGIGSTATATVGIGTSAAPTGKNTFEVVGIGTTTPSLVVGTGSGTAGVGIGTTEAPTSNTFEVVGIGSTNPSISVKAGIGTTAGYVGIGSSNPSFPLDASTIEKANIAAANSYIHSTGSAIFGGANHIISGDFDVIAGGGKANISGGTFNFIGGGTGVNVDHSNYSSSVGGFDNDIFSGSYSVIGGGRQNLISGKASESHSDNTAILGGQQNKVISAPYSFIGGGNSNLITGTSAIYSAILGGNSSHITNSQYGVILGGDNNKINYANSALAAGNYSTVQSGHNGAFVLSDSRTAEYQSTGGNTLNLRFQSGVFVDTDSGIYINGNPVVTGSSDTDVDTLQTVTDRGNTTTTSMAVHGQYLSGVSGIFDTVDITGADTLTVTGKVGIGEDSPAKKLQVKSDDNAFMTEVVKVLSNNEAQYTALGYSNLMASHELSLFTLSSQPISFRPNSVEKMHLTAGGSLGIGTDDPQVELDVKGDISGAKGTFTGQLTTLDKLAVGTPYSTYNATIDGTLQVKDVTNGTYDGLLFTSNVGGEGRIAAVNTDHGTKHPLQLKGEYIRFLAQTGTAVEAMRIVQGPDGSGRLGINTDDPSNTLDIHTSSNDQGIRLYAAQSSRTTAELLVDSATNGNAEFKMYHGTVLNTRIRSNVAEPTYFNAGSVGIGTASPLGGYSLNVTGDIFVGDNSAGAVGRNFVAYSASLGVGKNSIATIVGKSVKASSATNNSLVTLPYSTDGTLWYKQSYAAGHTWHRTTGYATSTTISESEGELMRLTTGGSLGLGVTAPDSTLEIIGAGNTNATHAFRVRDSDDNQLFSVRDDGVVQVSDNYFFVDSSQGAYIQQKLYARGGITDDQGNLQLGGSGNVNALYITNTGNVGIGTESPNSNLHLYAASSAPTFRMSRASNSQVWIQAIDSSARFLLQEAASEGGTLNTRLSIDDAGETLLAPNGGNVGIGTTNPETLLQVSGGDISIQGADGESRWFGFTSSASANTYVAKIESDHAANWGGNLKFFTGPAGGGNAERMRIAGDGDVGIGTPTPNAKLDVRGDISGSGNFYGTGVGSRITNNGTPYLLSGDAAAALTLQQVTDNGSTTTNHIGITNHGGASAYAPLNVSGGGSYNNLAFFRGTGTAAFIQFQNSTTTYGLPSQDGLSIGNNGNDAYVFNREAAPLYLGTSGEARMTILGDNTHSKVGIGTIAPASTAGSDSFLEIYGATDAGLVISSNNGEWDLKNINSSANLVFYAAGSHRVTFAYAGNVGIGSAAPAYKLDVAGDIQAKDSFVTVGFGSTRGYQFHDLGTGYGFKGIGSPTRLGVLVQGIESMTFESNGRVGIGSTNPENYKLEVIGDISGSGSFFGTGVGSRITNNGTPYLLSGDAAAALTLQDVCDNGNTTTTTIESTKEAGTAFSATSGTDRYFVVDASGRIGLNAGFSPTHSIEIDNWGNKRPANIWLNSSTLHDASIEFSHNGAYGFIMGSDETDRKFKISSGNALGTNDRLVIDTAGKVGIGTASPARKLEVSESSSSIVSQFKSTAGTSAYITLANTTSTADKIRVGSIGNDLILSSNYTDPDIYIKAGGDVGIGTTAPSGTLHILGGYDANNPNTLVIAGRENASTVYGGIQFERAGGTTFFGIGNDSRTDRDELYLGGGFGGVKAATAFRVFTEGPYGSTIGEERLTIVSGGNVGIGSATPAYELDVAGDIALNRWLVHRGNTGAYFGFHSNDNFRIQTDNTTALTVTDAQNVGIGTTAPEVQLHVKAGDGVTGVLKIEGGKNTVTAVGEINSEIQFGSNDPSVGQDNIGGKISSVTEYNNGAFAGLAFYTYYQSYGNLAERMRLTMDGRVGIGLTNPDNMLHVEGADEELARFKSTDNDVRIAIQDDTDTCYIGHDASADIMQLGFNSTMGSTDNLSIDTAGKVGIGTTNPACELQIDTPAANNAGQGIRINRPSAGIHYHSVEFSTNGTVDWSVGQNSNDAFEVYENGASATTRLTIKEGGNVGIGTTNPSNALDVVGHFSATSKSFLIDHPTKENKKLQYASLEGPENGVYVRGTTNSKIIELPEYWTELVHEDSITVVLTPIGKKQNLYIKSKTPENVMVGGVEGSYDYVIYGERKDVDKLEVEPLKV